MTDEFIGSVTLRIDTVLTIAALLLTHSLFVQKDDPRRSLPFTVEVLVDVEVLPYPQQGPERRGVIYADRGVKPTVIKKGQTFQTIKSGAEGSCTIRFAKKDYLLASCHWMPGFTDPQADIFKVLSKK
jgi:hypothetical protein